MSDEPMVLAGSERPSTVRIASWIGLVLGLMAVVLVAGTYWSNTTAPRLILQGVTVAAFAAWVVSAFRNSWWAPRRGLLLPGLVALAGIALSAALSSQPRLAWGGVLAAGCLLAAFLLLERLAAHPFFRRRLRGLVVLAAVLLPILYIVQVVLVWVEWWGLIGRVVVPPLRPAWAGLTVGSPNLVATVLLLLVPPALAIVATWTASTRRRTAAGAVLVVLAVAAVALTGSRGGMLGLGATVVVGIMLAVLRSGRLSRKVAALAAVMVLGALAAGVVVIAARGGQGGEDLRLELWRTALAVLAAHAVLGGGPDTWALLKLAEAQPGVTTLVVAHAHNVALWTLAELGIVGTAGVLVLAGAILVRLARRVADRDLATSAAAIGALAALAGVAAQSLVDVVTNLPSVVVLLALVLALALADEEDPHGSSQPSGRLRVAVGIAGVGVALLGISLVRVDIAMETASTGRMLLEYDPPAAQVRFAAAYDMDPNPLYRHEQALAAAFAGDLATASDLTDALVAEDGLAHHLVLQGYQRAAAGDRDGAAASAWLALDRGGSDPGVVLNVARIGELAGDGALARDALVLAAARAPETLDDPFWRSPDRALPYPELIREAAAAVAPGDPGAAAQILLVGGDPTAGAALDALPPGQREAAMALAGWREDPEAAISHLEARLEADPKDWVAAARLAWIASGVGRREEARRYARWAVIVQGDAASGIYSPPRSVGDAYGLPQFRLGGQYPDPVYKQQGSGLLFGPGSVTLIP